MVEDADIWGFVDLEDLWIFDKLILSKKLGYNCGPAGVPVPKSDIYCVRPIVNLLGMCVDARFENLYKETDHLGPSEFWCEVFYGKHVSVDYLDGVAILTVMGDRDVMSPFYKWDKWIKINNYIEYPNILKNLKGSYHKINCEFLDGHLIEVHLRHNPDFIYNNTIAIPVWDKSDAHDTDEYTFIENKDYKRLGFLIDKPKI